MTLASLPERIFHHEKILKHQIKLLSLKIYSSKSPADQEAYRANLISLLDHANSELMGLREFVKTIPPSEAMENLEAADNLRGLIAKLHVRLEDEAYLDSVQVYAALRGAIHGVFRLAGRMRGRAFYDPKKKRASDELDTDLSSNPRAAIIEALFRDQSA